MFENVGQFDAEFITTDNETVFELILAANYMDIKSLLELSCSKIASMIKGFKTLQFLKFLKLVYFI